MASAPPSMRPTVRTDAPSVPMRNLGSSGAMISLEASVKNLTAASARTFRLGRQDFAVFVGSLTGRTLQPQRKSVNYQR